MIQLQSIRLADAEHPDAYPFNIPLIRALGTLAFETEVTFLVGENGSGKSTLIEAIGLAAQLPIIGGEDARKDLTLAPVRALGRALKMAWQGRTRRGFLFRAEDFFRFARRMHETIEEMETLKREYAERFKDRPTAYGLTVGSMAGQAAEVESRYGRDLHENSHGESFLKFFQARFVPGGLYLMDEPEASLSPQRQLALLALMREMVEQDSQFIVATHAPILMAYPGATLLDIDSAPPRKADFDDLEHVSLTRAFLENPAAFLRHL